MMTAMRRLIVAVVAVAACAHVPAADRSIQPTYPATAGTAPLPRDLHVVTFNLHGQPGSVVIPALRNDPGLRGADLLVLEEVHGEHGCSTACEVAEAFGFHAVYAPTFADRGGTDGVAIVSRAPIDSAEVIQLPYYNVHINDEPGNVALAATVRIDGKSVTVYAVHLTNRLTVKQRAHQMAPVLAHAARQSNPAIIAGDFNTSPFTWLGHLFPIPTGTQDDRFEELMRAHGFATPLAHSGATHHWLAMKLDAIYTRGFDVQRFATADAADVSDHLALWATMSLK
jgi:endonuclease/exonuclease/phosphatase family metal-dependent hydrolase